MHFSRFSYLTRAVDGDSSTVLREHRAIVDVIRHGDADKARKAMSRHLDHSKQRAIRYFLG